MCSRFIGMHTSLHDCTSASSSGPCVSFACAVLFCYRRSSGSDLLRDKVLHSFKLIVLDQKTTTRHKHRQVHTTRPDSTCMRSSGHKVHKIPSVHYKNPLHRQRESAVDVVPPKQPLKSKQTDKTDRRSRQTEPWPKSTPCHACNESKNRNRNKKAAGSARRGM